MLKASYLLLWPGEEELCWGKITQAIQELNEKAWDRRKKGHGGVKAASDRNRLSVATLDRMTLKRPRAGRRSACITQASEDATGQMLHGRDVKTWL